MIKARGEGETASSTASMAEEKSGALKIMAAGMHRRARRGNHGNYLQEGIITFRCPKTWSSSERDVISFSIFFFGV